mmetsp:Transcript_4423/g.9249  ORF Transcript_4423/g.9249 Transcript_4423/m.9249 type:complete len:218 (-) Transcript_4423:767-1420(-)
MRFLFSRCRLVFLVQHPYVHRGIIQLRLQFFHVCRRSLIQQILYSRQFSIQSFFRFDDVSLLVFSCLLGPNQLFRQGLNVRLTQSYHTLDFIDSLSRLARFKTSQECGLLPELEGHQHGQFILQLGIRSFEEIVHTMLAVKGHTGQNLGIHTKLCLHNGLCFFHRLRCQIDIVDGESQIAAPGSRLAPGDTKGRIVYIASNGDLCKFRVVVHHVRHL